MPTADDEAPPPTGREDAPDSESAVGDVASARALLDPTRLLLMTVVAILALIVGIGVLGYYFREPLMSVSERFVDLVGGPGIAVGYFIPDAFTVPIPNDAFGMFGVAGGISFWVVVFWGTLGSISGGCTGWVIGRRLRSTRLVDRFMSGRRGRGLETAILRYGIAVVAVAALTPLPYSLSAWAAGGVRLPFTTFVAVSLLRVIRVAGSLYLIELGLMTTG